MRLPSGTDSTRLEGGSTYQIQIDAQSNFSSPDQDQTVSITAYTASDLAPGVYYWRVRARNDLDVAGAWSTARRLTRTSS